MNGFATRRKIYRGLDAAKVLLDNQLESLMLLKERGFYSQSKHLDDSGC